MFLKVNHNDLVFTDNRNEVFTKIEALPMIVKSFIKNPDISYKDIISSLKSFEKSFTPNNLFKDLKLSFSFKNKKFCFEKHITFNGNPFFDACIVKIIIQTNNINHINVEINFINYCSMEAAGNIIALEYLSKKETEVAIFLDYMLNLTTNDFSLAEHFDKFLIVNPETGHICRSHLNSSHQKLNLFFQTQGKPNFDIHEISRFYGSITIDLKNSQQITLELFNLNYLIKIGDLIVNNITFIKNKDHFNIKRVKYNLNHVIDAVMFDNHEWKILTPKKEVFIMNENGFEGNITLYFKKTTDEKNPRIIISEMRLNEIFLAFGMKDIFQNKNVINLETSNKKHYQKDDFPLIKNNYLRHILSFLLNSENIPDIRNLIDEIEIENLKNIKNEHVELLLMNITHLIGLNDAELTELFYMLENTYFNFLENFKNNKDNVEAFFKSLKKSFAYVNLNE